MKASEARACLNDAVNAEEVSPDIQRVRDRVLRAIRKSVGQRESSTSISCIVPYELQGHIKSWLMANGYIADFGYDAWEGQWFFVSW